MAQEGQQPKSSSWINPISLFLVITGLFLLKSLLFPSLGGSPPRGVIQAKNDVTQLITAIKAYNTEYGYLPLSERRMFLDEASQSALLQVLQGTDPNHTYNPRCVVFFEGAPAKSRRDGWFTPKYYYGGIHPQSGALLDPWGRPYRILLDDDNDGKIQSPYRDCEELHTRVIAWSLGKDGVQGLPGKENILKDADDIVSWR